MNLSKTLVAALSLGLAAHAADPMIKEGEFLTGCNYWASHAGMYMWRNWKPAQVEKDVADLAAHGVNVMRVFPLWPDFQPLERLARYAGEDRGLSQADGPFANEAGVNEEMMRRFRFLCDTAAKHDVRLVVGLVTGWMSGRMFNPTAFNGRNLITDHETVVWQTKFVKHFVRHMKDHPAILAWDLGNECECLAKDLTASDTWVWMHAITSAIRSEDARRPIVSGFNSRAHRRNQAWNARQVGEHLDELCTHPYPLFTPMGSADPFDTLRGECLAAAESLFNGGLAGRHCFVEEAGDLGRCTCSEERAAKAMRCAMATSWATGLGAYVWWCAFEQDHLRFAPYTWNGIERELGLFDNRRLPKPALKEMKAFRAFFDALPPELKRLPARKAEAMVLVSAVEEAWPQSFAACLLAKQAGFEVSFAYADAPLPPAKLYIVPAGKGCDPYEYETWLAVLDAAEKGATVLLTNGNNMRHSGIRAATGLEIDSFCSQPSGGAFELKAFPGRRIDWTNTTTIRTVARACDEVLAEDRGNVMMSVKRRGKGKVVFLNFPVETACIGRGDAFRGTQVRPFYLVYRQAAETAGLFGRIDKGADFPSVGVTEHALPDGGTAVVAVNYDEKPVTCPLLRAGKVARVVRGRVSPEGVAELPGNDFAVFEVAR